MAPFRISSTGSAPSQGASLTAARTPPCSVRSALQRAQRPARMACRAALCSRGVWRGGGDVCTDEQAGWRSEGMQAQMALPQEKRSCTGRRLQHPIPCWQNSQWYLARRPFWPVITASPVAPGFDPSMAALPLPHDPKGPRTSCTHLSHLPFPLPAIDFIPLLLPQPHAANHPPSSSHPLCHRYLVMPWRVMSCHFMACHHSA